MMGQNAPLMRNVTRSGPAGCARAWNATRCDTPPLTSCSCPSRSFPSQRGTIRGPLDARGILYLKKIMNISGNQTCVSFAPGSEDFRLKTLVTGAERGGVDREVNSSPRAMSKPIDTLIIITQKIKKKILRLLLGRGPASSLQYPSCTIHFLTSESLL